MKFLVIGGKKGFESVVSIILLLVVMIVVFVMVSNWFPFAISQVENNFVPKNSIEINCIEDGILYVRNYCSQDFEFSQVKINDVECNLSGELLGNNFGLINVSSCISGMSIGPKEVVLFMNSEVVSKNLMLNEVIFVQISPTSGAFSGFAWGENVGYISFNGTGYQVLMSNNKLYGYAWGENVGYISFNGTGYQVLNSGGVLTGYAYSEIAGFIGFNNSPIYQTTFNGTNLLGYAYSENLGYIHFDYPARYVTYIN